MTQVNLTLEVFVGNREEGIRQILEKLLNEIMMDLTHGFTVKPDFSHGKSEKTNYAGFEFTHKYGLDQKIA